MITLDPKLSQNVMSLRSARIYKITARVLKNFVDLTKFQQAPAYLRVGNYALGTYALGSLLLISHITKYPGAVVDRLKFYALVESFAASNPSVNRINAPT